MKKIFKNCIALTIVILVGCNGTDDNNQSSDADTDDDTGTEDSITLENAFPNLRFGSPVDLQSPDDGTDRIFVVEQEGTIQVFSNDETTSESDVFLDIQARIASNGELGLLGLAFHPNYSSNGFLYVTYTPSTNLAVVSRFQVSSTDSNIVDPDSETILLRIPQPFTNHNGGQLAFGADGYLYIASGDGGSAGDPQGNAQNRTNLLGKIVRIDVDRSENGLEYAIPSDNPFVGSSSSREEIYAYGLRNPWRFSFDVQTDVLWLGDVGQNSIEEIDIIENGGNYGWNILEGTQCFNNSTCDSSDFIAPIFEYEQNANNQSITGGYVYRGQIINSLQGRYIYGDFVSGRIWALSTNLGSTLSNELLLESGFSISSFGTDMNNELYVCAYFDGSIYKFVETGN